MEKKTLHHADWVTGGSRHGELGDFLRSETLMNTMATELIDAFTAVKTGDAVADDVIYQTVIGNKRIVANVTTGWYDDVVEAWVANFIVSITDLDTKAYGIINMMVDRR